MRKLTPSSGLRVICECYWHAQGRTSRIMQRKTSVERQRPGVQRAPMIVFDKTCYRNAGTIELPFPRACKLCHLAHPDLRTGIAAGGCFKPVQDPCTFDKRDQKLCSAQIDRQCPPPTASLNLGPRHSC